MSLANPIEFLPPAIQPELISGDPRFGPLSDLRTVLRDLRGLDIDAQHVRELVEARFLIGFNIGVCATAKLELRVLTKSLDFFTTHGGRRFHELADDPEVNWQKIFRCIVPHRKPVVTGLEIRRGLLCHATHVQNLIAAGHLAVLKKSAPGPGGSWTIRRDSYEAWLKSRML